MATVVITFFLITRFYVCKMDADVKERRRERISSQREKRWSMNSQRLEEIVAELMRPISDLRHSFDTDLSALLEEYLTEAGLHALDADDEEFGAGTGLAAGAVPNFAELALLLQQSASIYGRKVDFLYQHVLSVSDSLHNSTMELANTSHEDEPATPSTARRKRKASTCEEFVHIVLESSNNTREHGTSLPPPTLPRVYTELEPRVLTDMDTPLRDYDGEPIGLLGDFHVTWRLQDGLLVEELEDAGCVTRAAKLRPLPLLELQAALAARAEEAPPPLQLRDDTPPPGDPPPATPPPAGDPMPPPPPPPLPLKRERKRKSEVNLDDITGSVKLLISKELRQMLSKPVEFSGAAQWVQRVLAARTERVLRLRGRLRDIREPLRGFDFDKHDCNGFPGWSGADATSALAAAAALRSRRSGWLADDSDDDGFFEQSSDSDASRLEDSPLHTHIPAKNAPDSQEAREAAEWAAWRATLAARAAAAAARAPLDVSTVAQTVLSRVPPAPAAPVPFTDLLRDTADEPADVSRLLLASLFLANAGNIEIKQGAPLSVDSFSMQLLSSDPRLYSAAAANDPVSATGATSGPSATPNTRTFRPIPPHNCDSEI